MTWRNRMAVFVWGMAIAWNAMLVVMTRALLRDGAPSPLLVAVVTLFWIAGIAFAVHASRQACTTTQLFDDGALQVRQRFPFRRVEHRFEARDRPQATVVADTDNEGDPYFTCELPLHPPFGAPYRVAQGDPERCHDACERLNAARR